MCGICGWVSWTRPPDPGVVLKMADRLQHRGPDAGRVTNLGQATLGHRRLAVIDTGPQANQPMADSLGGHWIVYNGETYNFRELRAELSAKGAKFRTQSDTEVVLEAYKAWGADCVTRFNGMFAIAIWDTANRTLFLARDRLGKKPLFWSRTTEGGIVFSSEIKSILTHPEIEGALNPAAVSEFTSLNYVLGNTPVFQDVQLLPPGTFMIANGTNAPEPRLYWDLAESFRNKRRFKSDQQAAEELRALIDDAVSARLVSDVPVGIFLSGGIDSSAIAASVRDKAFSDPPHSFSIGFSEKSFDEVDEARATAAFLNIPFHEKTMSMDLENTLARMVYYGDTPFADSSFFPTYYLAQFARRSVTVALSGDGGDELFAGYETYAADRYRAAVGRLPRRAFSLAARTFGALLPVSFDKVSLDYKIRKFLRGAHLDADSAHYFWRTIFEPDEKRSLLRRDRHSEIREDGKAAFLAHAAAVAECAPLDRAMYVDIKTWLVDDILLKLDRTTMAHSLEARTPLLDYRVVEFAASLPLGLKMKGLNKKYLLKESQRGRIPDQVLTRKKRGFGAPFSYSIQGELHDFAMDATHDPVLDDWFEQGSIDKLWAAHLSKREDNGLKLLGIMNFSIWLNQIRQNTIFSPERDIAPTVAVLAP
ncbi:MAG TPA: asparagine synthase (glutamine-hydrolyzing) [Rhodospirillaceae bacterium]|nr:asparagine synthase (glutamine-hydrolyzing) [Rhodospirillaceae bacterium]